MSEPTEAEITKTALLIFNACNMRQCGWDDSPGYHASAIRAARWHLQQTSALREENKRLREALNEIVDVGCEYYDMDCGENGSRVIEQGRKALEGKSE